MKITPLNVKLRSWLISWNNYPDRDTVLEVIRKKDFRWCKVSAEVGPECGTPHVHIGIYFTHARTRSSLQKQFGTGKRFDGESKFYQTLDDYVSKPADHEHWEKIRDMGLDPKDFPTEVFFEEGDKPSPGKRTDLAAASEELMSGETTVEDIAISNPTMYHMYGRTLSKIEDIVLRKKYRTEMTKGTWLYGPTYTGKSDEQFKEYNPDTHYPYPDDNGWWDGYTGQETVIINDFRGCLPYAFLLKLVDKWPMHVRRRGREPAPFISKHVIISSPHPPNEVYNNLAERDSLDQLYRRFEIYYVPEFGVRLRAFDEFSTKTAQKCSKGNVDTFEPKKNMTRPRPKERDVFGEMYLENAKFND